MASYRLYNQTASPAYPDYQSLPYVEAEPVAQPPVSIPQPAILQPQKPPKKISGRGVAAFVLSLFAISFNWLIFFPTPINIVVYCLVLPFAVVGVILGWVVANGLLSAHGKETAKDRYGFFGLTLGSAALLLATAWFLLSIFVVWGWRW